MRRILGLIAVFLLCFFIDLAIPQSSLAMPIVGFAPFLCTLLGRCSKQTIIIMAICVGLCHDLFTLQHRLGVSSLAYVFAGLINLVFRRRYYEENVIPFFGVTFCLSLTYSLFFLLIGSFKGLVIAVNLKMISYQLILYPFFDAVVGLVGVFIPLKVYAALKKLVKKNAYES